MNDPIHTREENKIVVNLLFTIYQRFIEKIKKTIEKMQKIVFIDYRRYLKQNIMQLVSGICFFLSKWWFWHWLIKAILTFD